MKTATTTRAATSAPAWDWQLHRFRAMNSDVHIRAYVSSRRAVGRHVEDVFRYFEGLLSRFRPGSELSQLNDYDGPVFAAGADLYAAVEAAIWAAQQTHGIYDPTILSYLEQAGYDRTFPAITAPRPLVAAWEADGEGGAAGDEPPLAAGLDYRDVQLERFGRLIARPAGLRLDLGGMGKGWTVDRVTDDLCAEGNFLLNAGGDLYAYGAPPGERGWQVHLAHPWRPGQRIATLSLWHHAWATSTIAKRRWVQDGRVRHHLIDPRTGRPADSDVVSVSVVAGRVFTAEVFAKSALVLGLTEGMALLESLPEVEGLLVTTAGEICTTSGMSQFLERLDPAGYEQKEMERMS